MTKIKIFASDDLEKLVSDLNEFIEKEVDGIVDIRYESFPVFKRYNSSGVPTVASILDRVLIMYEPKQEDPEDDDCEFCSIGDMLESLASTLHNFSNNKKENKESCYEEEKPSYNPVERAYNIVKDLNERVSCMELYYEDRCIIGGNLEEILGYLGEALE